MKKIFVLLSVFVLAVLGAGCGTGGKNSTLEISGHVVIGKDGYQKITAPNNKLGFSVLGEVEPDEDGNVFISPFSLFMALSMVYNGADGLTKEEISSTLNVHGMDSEELNQASASL